MGLIMSFARFFRDFRVTGVIAGYFDAKCVTGLMAGNSPDEIKGMMGVIEGHI